MKLKSFFISFLSTLFLSCIGSTTAFATSITLGDVNNDGNITLKDAQLIQKYLRGDLQVTAARFTAMDYNQDMVIDAYDAQKIMQDYLTGVSYNTYDSVYTLPDNSERDYLVYNCATSSMEQPYSLAVPQDTINTFSEEELRAIPSLNNDNENTNCVEIITNYGNGSGILIDGNVIATAAHCIYDLNLGFPTNVTINIYNQNCTQIIATASAKKLHIPSDYVNSTSTYRPNYDYGLIYFDNITFYDNNYDPDLDIVNIGVMTDEFMTHIVNPSTQSTSTITLSGITSSNISGYTIYPKRRYFHAGQIMNMNDLPIEKPYRFKSSAHCIPGQSGGKVYYKPTVNYKSTVGIATHSTGNNVSDPNYGLYSYGIRMTPTILRFFLNNPNIS